MEKILVSACLLGEKTKYDGGDNFSPVLDELRRYFDFVPFCPEVEGGLSVPRKPSEIRKGRVFDIDGKNVTAQFNLGAEKAVRLAKLLNIRIAILKQRSPSCGCKQIHDGSFANKLISGKGITADALEKIGVWVMDEEEAASFLEGKKRQEEKKEEIRSKAKEKDEAALEKATRKVERKPRGDNHKIYGDKPRKSGAYQKKDKKPYSGKRPFKGKRKGYGSKRD